MKGVLRKERLYKTYKYNICGSTHYTYQTLAVALESSWEAFRVGYEGFHISELVRKMMSRY